MHDMIVKSNMDAPHAQRLDQMLKSVRQYNMRRNPVECTFAVRAEKFMGFYLTKRGIEANPNKCEVVIQMKTQTSKKDIQKLNGMLTAMNRFISKSA